LGRRNSVPRILVADDNSNIHRTVALALKEAGVEVVAVGNGEAAVRKIAEIKPDLVLADIFMPVRSGYEVCEFVKQDPRFAGVPVVLLIGAFDPFDEREAQRVRADAILKKPFVPPDSLLRTVADLLAQSASRVSPAPAPSVAKAETAAHLPAPASAAQPPQYMDAPPEEIAPAKARLEWDSDTQPVAFGTLLETPAAETDADDSVMTARRDPNLGEPAFWTPPAEAEGEQGEADPEESQAESTTPLGDEEERSSGAGVDELSPRATASSEIAQPESSIDLEDSVLELPELVLPVNQSSQTPAETMQDSTLDLPDVPELDLPPAEPLAPLPAPASLSEPRALGAEAPEDAQSTLPDLKDFAWAAPSFPTEPAKTAPHSEAAAESNYTSEKESIDGAAPGFGTLAPFLASLTSAASARGAAESPESFEFDSIPAPAQDVRGGSSKTESAAALDTRVASRLDPAVIEAIAQRVIERMQPEIIELVTRELLRPAVEALVQRELEKK
jgi:CheY-like chemotaxis protein